LIVLGALLACVVAAVLLLIAYAVFLDWIVRWITRRKR
jgi:Tfp pilus assembly protein FimT